MSEAATAARRPARVTTTRELALRLLAGQALHRTAGQWRVGDDLVPVDADVFAELQTGFRLVPVGDALPGFDASFAQTMLLEPLYSENGVRRLLRQAVDDAGGVTAFAARRRISKGQVGDALAKRYDTLSPTIVAALGLIDHKIFVPYRLAKVTAP